MASHSNSFPVTPRPKFGLVGHRGVAGQRPENTLSSFHRAAELNLNWIEFDTQLCKDGSWVIIHDETLDRTTNGSGLVRENTYNQLAQLEAGTWYTPPYENQAIPTLQQTLKFAYDNGIFTNIEVKSTAWNVALNVHSFVNALDTQLPHSNFTTLVSSFELPFLVKLRKEKPQLPIGYLVDHVTEKTWQVFAENRFTTLNCNIDFFNQEVLTRAQAAHIPVLLFTVNEADVASYWLDKGVAAIFTDHPERLIQQLRLT